MGMCAPVFGHTVVSMSKTAPDLKTFFLAVWWGFFGWEVGHFVWRYGSFFVETFGEIWWYWESSVVLCELFPGNVWKCDFCCGV